MVATLQMMLDVISGNKSGKREQEYHGLSEVELQREKCAFCGKTSKNFRRLLSQPASKYSISKYDSRGGRRKQEKQSQGRRNEEKDA